ncbi:chromosome segregation protein Csm1/Pcs1-domain-containing protein [Lasiosphaeris hirsuta]|uniref:Chromosome segregation protein Csm1/Pcs1-domain-containing protein n=1 Tax=Lasiosphaeris hirsuta TaxID=260670 RepID=A0AA40AFQ4_9PEZI|nr:chromosome segregation protein Csm1/Pcs1-domain-containing protein [Lasiosphaeris hirsuta]
MSRVKARSNLLKLVDSDSEDGLNSNSFAIAKPKLNPKQKTAVAPQTKKATANMAPAKRQPAKKVTKTAPAPKTSTRRHSGRLAAALEQATDEEARDVLIEKSANAQPKPTRGRKKAVAAVEEDDVDMEDAPPAESEPPTKPKAARGRPRKAGDVKVPATAPKGRKPAAKEQAVVVLEEDETEIPETQQQEQYDGGSDDDLSAREFLDPPEVSRRVPSSPAKRPAYSSSEGDPALRRRLGEMTQKYESLELKYRDLRELAVKEADNNFDRLKRQTDEKSKAAEQLIASLKSELAVQREAAKETQRLRKQLDASETKADELQAQITSLTTSLSESKTEAKALNMKLSAARAGEAAANSKVPGSAMKGSNVSSRMVGTSEAIQQATFAAQMKEDLYADVTGLIVRSFKREGREDFYDCIQTGRNGTLHFKLAIVNDSTSDSYDEAQYLYQPQLDSNRDRALIDMLPDYLVEEITFPRPHAAKFYARVVKALTEPAVSG